MFHLVRGGKWEKFRDVLVEKNVTLSWFVNSNMVNLTKLTILAISTLSSIYSTFKEHLSYKTPTNGCLHTNTVNSQKNISNWILFFTFTFKKLFRFLYFFSRSPQPLYLKKIQYFCNLISRPISFTLSLYWEYIDKARAPESLSLINLQVAGLLEAATRDFL